ncbi:MAG: hypothetical protein J7L55_03875 [Desulfurococcales archaeon]|nr:hypothetical protein [Desulfurococcales archaeon]
MHKIRPATPEELRFLRAIADLQLRREIGHLLFPEGVLLRISRNTGKIREVLTPQGRSIATVVASTYTLHLRLWAAIDLLKVHGPPWLRAVVADEVAEDVVNSKSSVFARHVLAIDDELRPGDEVVVTDESDKPLCVGRLVLSPEEVLHFIKGVAIKVRECVGNEAS